MKLRNKILIGVIVVWSVFTLALYIGSNFLLAHSFLVLEQDRANRDLARVDQALKQNLYSLYTFTSDWSHWNDLYDFLQGKNPQFVTNNLNMTAYINASVNLLTYWYKNGKLAIGVSVDLEHRKIVPYPKGLDKYIYPGSILLDRHDVNQDIQGYIAVPDGVMMIAAVAATDGDKLKPAMGMMITGRMLSAKIIKEIEDITKLSVDLFTPQQIAKDNILKSAFAMIEKNDGHLNRPINQNILHGYSIIRDINDQPIGMLRITTPRIIYKMGEETVKYFLLSVIFLGILFTVLMSGLLRRLVIKRLERLNHDVAEISINNELSQRIDVSGNDEVASVSSQINRMLSIIQSAHEKLEHRVDERTQELQKANIKLEQEIIERKTIEQELIQHKEYLSRIAHYDVLTSLPNRVLFNEILNNKLKESMANKRKFAVLFMDLDRFKTINDAMGHHIGDLVLQEIAKRIQSCLKKEDTLARLGGDEFIILISNNFSIETINKYAEEILQKCCKQILIDSYEFYVSMSIGISLFPDDGSSLEDLQKNADMAMYKSKRDGGSNYKYYTKEMNVEAHERIRLDKELRRALKEKEFILFYQPKVNIKTGKMEGVEALIRWNHPELGIINPASFVHFAEETGIIIQIGEWALREACRVNKAWQKTYVPISVAVNLSPKQFRHQDIAQIVKEILQETELSPEYLELEITESAVMDDLEAASDKLNEVKKMGVKTAIDDFGTGYTSINYLKKFTVNHLKIDQGFIKEIPKNDNDVSIVTAIITLAHNLGMSVIAEGVETVEQYHWLADHECDVIQGYFISRPLPESKIISEFTRLKSNEISR